MEGNTAEYLIKEQNTLPVVLKKVGVALCYVVVFVAILIAIISLSPTLLVIPLILVDAAFVGVIAFATWRFVCVEYEIVISRHEISFTTIYGRTVRRPLEVIPTESVREVGNYDEGFQKLEGMSLQKSLMCVSSMSAPVIYYALYGDGKDQCVVCFEADDNAIKLFKQYNPSAFRASGLKI